MFPAIKKSWVLRTAILFRTQDRLIAIFGPNMFQLPGVAFQRLLNLRNPACSVLQPLANIHLTVRWFFVGFSGL